MSFDRWSESLEIDGKLKNVLRFQDDCFFLRVTLLSTSSSQWSVSSMTTCAVLEMRHFFNAPPFDEPITWQISSKSSLQRAYISTLVAAITVSCLTPELLHKQDSPMWLPGPRTSPVESNLFWMAVQFALPAASNSVASSGSDIDTNPEEMKNTSQPISPTL